MKGKLTKKKISSMDNIYTANAFCFSGEMNIGFGPEREGASFIYDMTSNQTERVGSGPGGMMSLVPIPDRNDMLVSVMGLFPPFKGLQAGIFRHWKQNGIWHEDKVIDLPFAHRCEIIKSTDGRLFLISCSVSSYKDSPSDWSHTGCVYISELNNPEDDKWPIKLLSDKMSRNHGMLKCIMNGRECVCVSADEGIFAVYVDERGPHIDMILDRPVSEFGFADLDGDGVDEIATIEPFHGESLNIYHSDSGHWNKIASDVLSFGHGLSAGKLGEKNYVAVGNRAGDKNLSLYSITDTGSLEKYVAEFGSGTTQTQFFSFDGTDYLLSANQLLSEVAIYSIDNNHNMKNIVYEENIEVNNLPGRDLQWYFTPEMNLSDAFSMNVVLIKPGFTVSPAHSHPTKEEIIYVVSGEGKAYIDGVVYPIHQGTSVLFPKGSVHMLRNSGVMDMKVVCFFTPQATFADYKYHDDQFPED